MAQRKEQKNSSQSLSQRILRQDIDQQAHVVEWLGWLGIAGLVGMVLFLQSAVIDISVPLTKPIVQADGLSAVVIEAGVSDEYRGKIVQGQTASIVALTQQKEKLSAQGRVLRMDNSAHPSCVVSVNKQDGEWLLVNKLALKDLSVRVVVDTPRVMSFFIGKSE